LVSGQFALIAFAIPKFGLSALTGDWRKRSMLG
jgi:hypothetical protein